MWEASPNAYYHQLQGPEAGAEESDVAGSTSEDEDEDATKQAPDLGENVSDVVGIGGMISTEEARDLLVAWNIIEPHVLGQQIAEGRIYDVKGLIEAYGPWSRVYDDGHVACLSSKAHTR